MPSVPLQQALRHLERAFLNSEAGRASEPTLKRKHDNRDAAEFTRGAFQYDPRSQSLSVSKIGPLRVRWSRALPASCSPSRVTITRDAAGRTFASILVDETITPLPPANTSTGLDLGLRAWITTSEGERVCNPRVYARYEHQLKRAQRGLSHKQPASRNRESARIHVARLNARIANARRDAMHKLTTRIVSENQAIARETLHVAGMRRNHTLAKAISDAAWSELARQITYKSAWYGRALVRASPWFPSTKRCSVCGQVQRSLPLSVRHWQCECGASHDRCKRSEELAGAD